MGENKTISCPKCGGTMLKTLEKCPHFGCYAFIFDEMEYLRTIVKSTIASKEEKENSREQLDELEAAYD